jgi:hypothetical protein
VLARSKARYCAQHNYALLDETYFTPNMDVALPLQPWMRQKAKTARFRKLQFLEMILRARLPFKWLLWLDGDTLFTQPSYSVEERLSNALKLMPSGTRDPYFVLAKDQNGVNNGVWLIRNLPQVHKIMLDIFNQQNDVKRYWADQLSLINFMESNPQFVKDRMLVLPEQHQRHWQAYPAQKVAPEPWILHFAGLGMEDTKSLLEARGLECANDEKEALDKQLATTAATSAAPQANTDTSTIPRVPASITGTVPPEPALVKFTMPPMQAPVLPTVPPKPEPVKPTVLPMPAPAPPTAQVRATARPLSTRDQLLRVKFMSVANATSAKIAVVTLHLWAEQPDWVACSLIRPKQRYCAQHGYALLDEALFTSNMEAALALKPWMRQAKKTPRFRKLQYLEMLLRTRLPFKWFLWVDGDTVFTDPSYSVDDRLNNALSLLPSGPREPWFVLAEDRNGINNGVWLIRNTPEVHNVILGIFNQEIDTAGAWADQRSLINYMEGHPQFVKERVLVIPKANQQEWQASSHHTPSPRSWILHLAGLGMRHRKILLESRGLLCSTKADYPDLQLRDKFMAVVPTGAMTAQVAVVTLHLWKDKPEWIDCTFVRSKQSYCARHGYTLLDETYFTPHMESALALQPWMRQPAKTPRFRKLQYLEMLLRAGLPCKWFLWIDGDTVFTNPSYSVDDRLDNAKRLVSWPPNRDDPLFVLTKDLNGVNNGVWLIRNSPKVHEVVVDIFNQRNDMRRYWADQLSLINYMQGHPQFVKDHMLVLPEKYQPHWQAYHTHKLTPVPWILHLAGHGMDTRKKYLEERGLGCDKRDDDDDAAVVALQRHRLQAKYMTAPNMATATVVVVTLQSSWEAHEWAECTFKRSKRRYCEAHGYAMLDESFYTVEYELPALSWMSQRHKVGRFRKLQFLEMILRAQLPVKWLLWMDGDTVLLNPSYTVENRLTEVQKTLEAGAASEPWFVLARDWNGMNNGVWLIRNTPEVHKVMIDIFNTEGDVHHAWADQLSLKRYFDHNPKFVKDKVWMLSDKNQNVWQAYPSSLRNSGTQVRPRLKVPEKDAWVLHFPGMSMDRRKQELSQRGLLCTT